MILTLGELVKRIETLEAWKARVTANFADLQDD